MNEKPEKLNHRKTATEKKLIAAKHREKQLKHVSARQKQPFRVQQKSPI